MNNTIIRKFAVGFSIGSFAFLCMLFGRWLERGAKDTLSIIIIFIGILVFGILMQVIIGLDTAESLKKKD